jgi:diguanylate cyclase (GGDEF)-like protein
MLVGLSDPTDDVMQAIAFHHGGPNGDQSPSAEAACVQIGNAVAHLLGEGETDVAVLNAALDRLGRGPDLLDEVAEKAGANAAAGGPAGELAEQVGRLEAVAHTDDLTGLANRRAWIETVRRELAQRGQGALLICDVDGFKSVNDGHGHRAGDLVLTEVARVLARHGIAGRLGGDEFGVWVGEDGAGHRTARAIMDDIAGALPGPLTDGEIPLGISVGVATVTDPHADVMELLEIADRELYAVKPGGRRR